MPETCLPDLLLIAGAAQAPDPQKTSQFLGTAFAEFRRGLLRQQLVAHQQGPFRGGCPLPQTTAQFFSFV